MKRLVCVLIGVGLIGAVAGCSVSNPTAVPKCSATERLGLIAQSVPTSGYIPCIGKLSAGWRATGLVVQTGRTSLTLTSDRARGHPVHIDFRRSCSSAGATAIPPRTPGGRSFLRLSSIAPRYAGTMYDVFPGGCVTYDFNFERGPHIPLMAELGAEVRFISHSDLRLRLQKQLGVELGP